MNRLPQHFSSDQCDATCRYMESPLILEQIETHRETVRYSAVLVDYRGPNSHRPADVHIGKHNRLFDDASLLHDHVGEQQRVMYCGTADDASARNQRIPRLAACNGTVEDELRWRTLFLQCSNWPGGVVHVEIGLNMREVEIRCPVSIECTHVPPIRLPRSPC